MTVEFGESDERASLLGRLAAPMFKAAMWPINVVDDDLHYRYDSRRATVSISGESEHAGDPFERGKNIAALSVVAMLIPLLGMVVLAIGVEPAVALFGQAIGWVYIPASLTWVAYSFITMAGVYTLSDKLSVVDHTTEPAPDELDEIKQRYQNGEIDEEELEREAAEVWER